MTKKEKQTYDSYISPININYVILFLNLIILSIKGLLAYNFLKQKNNNKLFNILLIYILFYYSIITLSWSNKRLESLNIIISQFIDTFVEHFSVFVADMLLVIIIFITRRQPRLTKHKNVMKLLALYMVMRMFIQGWKITQIRKMHTNTEEYNKHITKKKFVDNLLEALAGFLTESKKM